MMRICRSDMYIIIKIKDTDNIIGVKEAIAMRLEDIADIVRIDVREEVEDAHRTRGRRQP